MPAPKSIYDEPANLLLPSVTNPGPEDIAAEEERKRKERELRAKAALAQKAQANKVKGLSPSGRKLKAKDKPQPAAPTPPRKLLPDNLEDKAPWLPISWARKALKDDGKEGALGLIKETARVADAAITQMVEGVAETALWGATSAYSFIQKNTNKSLIAKIAGGPLPALPKSWDPLEKEYRYTLINSMSKDNRPSSWVGNMGADVLSFATATTKVAAMLPKIGLVAQTAGKGKLAKTAVQAVTGLPASFVADFLLTKPGDPNFASMVRDLPFVSPEIEDVVSLGLASSRTDNAFWSKLKAGVSGSLPSAVGDALTFLIASRKWSLGFAKQGMPPDEAMARGVAAGAEEAKAAKAASTGLADKQWPVATTGRLRELETKRVELEAELAELDLRAIGKPLTPELKQELDNLQPTDPSLKTPEAAPETSPELQAAEQRLKEITSKPDPDTTEFEAAAAEVDRLTAEQAAKAEPDVPPLEDGAVQQEAKRMEDINRQLADINDEKAQLEMDLSSDPASLRAEDQATFDESTTPSQAAADQIRLETSVPRIARRADVDPTILKGATSPTMGKSPSVFTDAFYKILQTAPDVTEATIKVIRQTASDMDLRAISKAAGRPINEVVADATRFIDAFRQANASAGDAVASGDDLIQTLREQKFTKTVTEDGNSKELLNAQGIVAAKTIITDTANQIYQLAQSIDELYTAGRNPGNQMDRLVDRLVAISELHKLTGAASGYSLRMFREIIGGQTGKVAPDMTPSAAKAQQTKFLKDWATDVKKLSRAGQDAAAQEKLQALVKVLVLNGGDPGGTVRQFTLLTRVGAQLAMDNIYNSILSGPITQLRNATGNFYSTVEKPLSLGLAGVFRNDAAARYAAVAAYRGLSESLSDAFEVMRISFQTGEPLQVNRRFVLQEADALAKLEAIRLTTGEIKPGMDPKAYSRAVAENAALGVVDTLYRVRNNSLFNWSSRALTAADDFFKIINSRMKIAMDSAYAAHSAGLSPKELDARYADIYTQKFTSSFHDDLQIKDEALLDWTDASTFQDNPGGFINRLSNLLEEAPILRLAMPFVRTPYNLMVYSAQHFPLLNLASSRARAVLSSMPGDPGFDPVAKSIMQGRQAIGATVFGAIALGALQGNIRGNGPPPGPARELWLQEGPAKAVKVMGRWVSYETIEPINNFMALGADVALLARMGYQDAAERIGQQLLFAFAVSVVDKSYLSGLTVVAGFLDPKTYTSGKPLTRGLVSTANNLLPMAGARRAMSNTLNPYLREIDGELNKMLAVAVPGYALNSPTKIDPFTNKPFTSLSGGWYNAISPFRIYDKDFPEGTDEAIGQEVAAGLTEANWDSSTLTTKFDQGEEIAADERAAFAKALYAAKLAPRLKELFDSPRYQQALSSYKARTVGLKAEESEHSDLINDEISDVKKEARAMMLNSSEKWRTRNDLVIRRKAEAGRGDINAATQTFKALEALNDDN